MMKTIPQKKPLTVVILTDFAHCEGGAAKIAIQSALGLATHGLSVVFIAGCGPVDPDLEASRVQVTVLGLPSISRPADRRRSFWTALWNRTAAQRVSEILKPLDPAATVVHLHSWTKVLSSSVVPAIKDRGFRLVLTLHDYFTACPNGGFFDYPAETICTRAPMGLSCISHNCDARKPVHKIWRVVRQALQRHRGGVPKRIDGFISISALSERILKPFLPASAPLWRVENPIESTSQSAARPDQGQGVLFVGRLAAEKGPELLAKAAIAAGVTVTFAGDGPLKEHLQNFYPQHVYQGWVDFATISTLLTQTRALVLPSLWYETLGLSVLEAMAQGVPAIVSAGCAAADVVTDGQSGLIFTHGDQTALTEALRRLSDDAVVYALGRGAHQAFWQAPPTLDRHVNELVAVYQQLLR